MEHQIANSNDQLSISPATFDVFSLSIISPKFVLFCWENYHWCIAAQTALEWDMLPNENIFLPSSLVSGKEPHRLEQGEPLLLPSSTSRIQKERFKYLVKYKYSFQIKMLYLR